MENNHNHHNHHHFDHHYDHLATHNLELDDIRAVKILGKGAMGTVFLAYNHITDPDIRSPFALKVVEKCSLSQKHDADRRARWEMCVLSSFSSNHMSNFLPTLLGSFEADDLMGWAVPYCSGGDLNSLRYHQVDHVFSPCAIRFYLAEIACALAHLHSMGIAYRDLKPENVLVQSSGHVTLTDFDLSRKLIKKKKASDPEVIRDFRPVTLPLIPRRRNNHLTRIFAYAAGGNNNLGYDTCVRKTKSARVSPRRLSFAGGKRSNSFVGTEEYVSPEVVRGEGHEFGVDWWALGVLAYEMLYGKTPFRGKNRKETFRNVLMKQPEFVGERTALIDLIERLLEKDPMKRLGHYKGAEEIKEHEFFKGLRWDLLVEVMRPPYVPSHDEDVVGCFNSMTSFDVREYFNKLRAPPSIPPSPPSCSFSSSSDDEANASLTDF